jgi:hypothetical protein
MRSTVNTEAEDGPGILALWNDCSAGQGELYETWYQTEHLHDRVSIAGFRLGRRHEIVGSGPRFFTYYETDSDDVLFSSPYLEQLDNPSPLTRKVMKGVFTNVSRTVCTCVRRVGESRGNLVITARSASGNPHEELCAVVDALGQQSGVLRAELWVCSQRQSGYEDDTPRQEELIRGRDTHIESCLVAHTVTMQSAQDIANSLVQVGRPDDQIGIYRFLCELHHEDCRS